MKKVEARFKRSMAGCALPSASFGFLIHSEIYFATFLPTIWRSQNTIMSCQILPLLCHITIMWSQNTLKWFQTCDQLEWDLAAKCSNYQQLLIMKKNQVAFMIYSDVFTLLFMVCRVYRRIYQPIKVWTTCLPGVHTIYPEKLSSSKKL